MHDPLRRKAKCQFTALYKAQDYTSAPEQGYFITVFPPKSLLKGITQTARRASANRYSQQFSRWKHQTEKPAVCSLFTTRWVWLELQISGVCDWDPNCQPRGPQGRAWEQPRGLLSKPTCGTGAGPWHSWYLLCPDESASFSYRHKTFPKPII